MILVIIHVENVIVVMFQLHVQDVLLDIMEYRIQNMLNIVKPVILSANYVLMKMFVHLVLRDITIK